MPLVVELGISFDVIVAVLVLGVLVHRIVHRFESMDVSRLSKLKGSGRDTAALDPGRPTLTALLGVVPLPRRLKEVNLVGFGDPSSPWHGQEFLRARRPARSTTPCGSTGCLRSCSSSRRWSGCFRALTASGT
jgi:hypothetical protein